MSKYLVILFFLLGSNLVQAQPNDRKLAQHYYESGEYEKALLYFEKFYRQQASDYNYQNYLKTLIALEEYKDAEKLVKKQKKLAPGRQRYELDHATVFELTNQQEKAEDIYAKLIKDVKLDYRSILELGQAFRDMDMLERALEVFTKGKQRVKSYPFGFKTAEIHGKLGNHEAMLNDYLDVIVDYNNYVPSVQNALSRILDFEHPENPKTDQLRTVLLGRIQKSPDELAYSEMLIWYFLQIQDFNGAMIQAKAMDRRVKNGNGEDVMQLSRMCRSNKAYDVAIKGYEYIVAKYPNGYHYNNARLEMMDALNDKITTSKYTQEDLKLLETRFEEILQPNEMGRNSVTVPIMRKLAHLEAFYLGNRSKAITILKEAVNIPRVSFKEKGLCKMELGDVYVMEGLVWDASLMYLQVEKEFKEDILGHEAKFRNARVYYFTGEFEYAQAQLDVLKASTSKLISNDAMELSLLITDNLGLDSTLRPMLLFSQADLYIFQNRFNEANACLDTIDNIYGDHALSDEILYRKYEMAKKRRNWEEAVGYLAGISEGYGDDILGDDAVFEMAEIYQYQLKDKAKAKEFYKKILFEYEGSIYTAEARKQFRALGGNNSKEIKIIDVNEEEVEDESNADYDQIKEDWPINPSVEVLRKTGLNSEQYLKMREQLLKNADRKRYENEESAP